MDTEKFNIAVLPLQNKLFRFAMSILKNETNAEDALQEILVKLWEMRNKLHNYTSIEAFAMRIMKNHCIDRLRKEKSTSEIQEDVANSQNYYNTDTYTELKDVSNFAYRLIEKLPPMQQIIMRLRDVEEYDLDEIADIMDMSAAAVRTNLCRARQTVREQLIQIQTFDLKVKK